MIPDIGIDPGHGGTDTGAVRNGITEAAYVWSFAHWWGLTFSAAYPVRMLRREDEDPTFTERARRAEGCSLVVSLHCNAHPLESVRGLTAFYRAGDIEAKAVAQAIVRATPEPLRRKWMLFDTENLPNDDRDDWKQRPHNVIERYDHCPAVLIELGYLSNPDDALLLRMPVIQHGLAVACEAGVTERMWQIKHGGCE